jgi:2-oxoglutarate ferredoxin oxidoreductase subunit alpha
MHALMNEKRFRKFEPLREYPDLFLVEGDLRADLAMISWGTSAGVCREALQLARAEGLRVKLLVPYLLYPVIEHQYREFFAGVRAGLVVEQSHQGQLYRMLRMFVDVPPAVQPMARSGANPFQPSEVVERLRDVALRLQRRGADTLQSTE